jgi:hypothetical protein
VKTRPNGTANRCSSPCAKIESATDTLQGQLDLEPHGARTFEGVAIRVAGRAMAPAAAIWHKFGTGQAVSRSLTAYGHEELLA